MRARRTLVGGLGFPEGPRWRGDRLWFSDMGQKAVFTVDLAGRLERQLDVPRRPSGLGWLPSGELLVVSMGDRRVLRRLPSGELVVHADLSQLASHDCNDMVVDGRGNAYVGNAGFDLRSETPRTAQLVLVTPDGAARVVDDEVVFPNGSVVTPDGGTLIVAETFAARLTAFSITADGGLAERRVFAPLPGVAPDGICLDAEGGVWVADATGVTCLRVLEGGEVADRVDVGRHCFACALGGTDRRTLFVLAADDFAGEAIARRNATIEIVDVDCPGAGWP